MGYFQDWAVAKKTFETKTGGAKKPSEKVLGVFRKSSGLEKACKGLDDSLKTKAVSEMQKAEDLYRQASKSYSTLLMQTSTTDKDGDYKAELRKLEQALYDIIADFVKERDKTQKETLKKAEKDLGGYAERAKKAYYTVLSLQEKAEAKYQECDSSMRDVITGKSQNNTGAVKRAAVALNAAIKDLSTLVGEIKKLYTEWNKKVNTDLATWRKGNKDLIALFQNECNGIEADILRWPMTMKLRNDRAEELMSDAKQLMVTASNALKGAVNTDQVFANSLAKFIERAEGLAGNMRSTITSFEGDVDEPQNEYDDTIKETEDNTEERTTRFARIEDNLKQQLVAAVVHGKRIEKAILTLDTEWQRFPGTIRDDKEKYGKQIDAVEYAMNMLEQCKEDLKKAVVKRNKLLGKVQK